MLLSAPSIDEVLQHYVVGTREEVLACLKIQQAVRRSLEVWNATDGEVSLRQDDCAVCYGLLCEPVRWPGPDGSSCDHLFCKPCVREWGMQENASCPMCRTPAARRLTDEDEVVVDDVRRRELQAYTPKSTPAV